MKELKIPECDTQMRRPTRERLWVVAWFALPLSTVTQSAGAAGYFETPAEIAVRGCGESALTLHPGAIDSTEVLRSDKAVRVEIHVRDEAGKVWIVLCDGTSGKLLGSIDLDTLRVTPFTDGSDQAVK